MPRRLRLRRFELRLQRADQHRLPGVSRRLRHVRARRQRGARPLGRPDARGAEGGAPLAHHVRHLPLLRRRRQQREARRPRGGAVRAHARSRRAHGGGRRQPGLRRLSPRREPSHARQALLGVVDEPSPVHVRTVPRRDAARRRSAERAHAEGGLPDVPHPRVRARQRHEDDVGLVHGRAPARWPALRGPRRPGEHHLRVDQGHLHVGHQRGTRLHLVQRDGRSLPARRRGRSLGPRSRQPVARQRQRPRVEDRAGEDPPGAADLRPGAGRDRPAQAGRQRRRGRRVLGGVRLGARRRGRHGVGRAALQRPIRLRRHHDELAAQPHGGAAREGAAVRAVPHARGLAPGRCHGRLPAGARSDRAGTATLLLVAAAILVHGAGRAFAGRQRRRQ